MSGKQVAEWAVAPVQGPDSLTPASQALRVALGFRPREAQPAAPLRFSTPNLRRKLPPESALSLSLQPDGLAGAGMALPAGRKGGWVWGGVSAEHRYSWGHCLSPQEGVRRQYG